jgi:hypothetical protein
MRRRSHLHFVHSCPFRICPGCVIKFRPILYFTSCTMAALFWRLALLKITSSDGFIEAPPTHGCVGGRAHVTCPSPLVRAQERSLATMLSNSTRFVCLACADRHEATYFSKYQSAASHVRNSKRCKSYDRGIGTVTLVHKKSDAEAGGSGAAGPWPPAPQTASMVGSPSHSSAGSYMIYMYFVQSFR